MRTALALAALAVAVGRIPLREQPSAAGPEVEHRPLPHLPDRGGKRARFGRALESIPVPLEVWQGRFPFIFEIDVGRLR